MAYQGHLFAPDSLVVDSIADGIFDVAAEFLLTLVSFLAGHSQVARKVADARVTNFASLSFVVQHEAICLVDVPLVCGLQLGVALINRYLLHIRLEAAVRDHPVLFRHLLEMRQQLVAGGPRRQIRRHGVVLVVLQMVRTQFSLQLRRLVGLIPPGCAAHRLLAIVQDEVRIAMLEEPHGLPQSSMSSPYDHHGVLPSFPLALEARDALHDDLSCDLLDVELLPHVAALLGQEDQRGAVDAQPLGQHALDFANLRA
mmetsp:Transcript_17724/g.44888  ORF Transcript_17724/g.44888 Transcript_17724/m.44888 type:complete len:256 (-) Transcript_17724:241-1008(-)